ncbi:alpha/beta hydrolase [Streptomyces hirsutus]|uniref:alpha/beta fold hydrolase n=1 Tax=Streptomyces hirsutus TaxID=35620 RepID=UPI0034406A1A
MADKPAIVLVHGGSVDGSGWRAVHDLLTHDGYPLAVVQNPTLSLQGDTAAARMIIDARDGPVVLVGHSYGGAVITEAGTAPNMAALVYIAAFASDAGEAGNTLLAGFPPPACPDCRSCRPRKASCSSTGTNSPHRSQVTWPPAWLRSWPTPRPPSGAWTPSGSRSPSPPGGPGQAGTCSLSTTR